MSDTSKRLDELLAGDVDDIETLLEIDRLSSIELKVQAGQSEQFAEAQTKAGDLMKGKTAEDVARLKRLNNKQ
ncbi:MAG TPA: hypothetical protein QF469_19155 [Sphingomonas sanguinis]|uniref:hypothetical protein n=1 Tax=Sphingomonas sanguinis TaxID=33051 RepID=UPI002AC07AEC|nr:hypothetical protein [Sphingomonas sanguinis]